MELYLPVVVLSAIAGLLAVGSVLMSSVVGPKRYNRARLDSYECGIDPVADPGRNARTIPVRYYTIAMTFIIFDVEIMFLVPWACTSTSSQLRLLRRVLFILNLSLAYCRTECGAAARLGLTRPAVSGCASGTTTTPARCRAAGRDGCALGLDPGRTTLAPRGHLGVDVTRSR